MRRSISEFIFSIASSRNFMAFIDGVPITLPNCERVQAKVESYYRSPRPKGFRFSKFAFVTKVRVGAYIGQGFGEAETKLSAFQKSIAEGMERAVYRAVKNTISGSPNTNGWAAHLNRELAMQAGLEELLERDAVLIHWLSQTPMMEIDSSSFPRWLSKWIREELLQAPEYRRLRLLFSTAGYVPSITSVLVNDSGNAVMSHATAATLEKAVYKSLAETCRIAQIALEGHLLESSYRLGNGTFANERFSPEDHAMVYAYHLKFPSWVFGQSHHWHEARRTWTARWRGFSLKNFDYQFHQMTDGPLVIGYCTSSKIQNLFFGKTKEAQAKGLINVERLKEVMASSEVNSMPHCIA